MPSLCFSRAIGEGKVFPNVLSLIIFVLYMGLFISQGILITASRGQSKQYSYNTTTVVLFTECTKLIAALCLYFSEGFTISQFINHWKEHRGMLIYYLIPSGLYTIYNNLTFISLAKFDPTTYFLLLQFRVVVTGVIFQCLFKKTLSKIQWLSLCILTFGCILKEFKKINVTAIFTGGSLLNPNPEKSAPVATATPDSMDFGLVFILFQVFASCFAGVYNEYLLKDKGSQVNIWFQNICMYLDSIVCNIFALSLRGDLSSAFTSDSLEALLNAKVIAIILDNAAIGIVTALFLKNLNSILKTFASAMEIMFTAVLCWMIFGIPIDFYTVFAIAVVSAALLLYSKNPVVNPAKPNIQGSDNSPLNRSQMLPLLANLNDDET